MAFAGKMYGAKEDEQKNTPSGLSNEGSATWAGH